MAGGTTRYRQAYNAGSTGKPLPEGLASMADTDPHIDAAHDAGRNGADYDEFLSSRGLGTKKSAPASRPPTKPSGRTSSKRSRPSPRIPSPGTPSLKRPLGKNVAVGAGTGLAGLMLGAVVYAVLLSVVEYGSKGPGMWFEAKFLNKAPSSSTSSGAAPNPNLKIPPVSLGNAGKVANP
jgi:hypothetical protein